MGTKPQQPKERKAFPATVVEVDEEQGVVKAIVSVFGNVDDGEDRIHPGAFVKTITERLGRIRVLDNHNNWSITDVIGKPLALREVGRDELPPDVLLKYPEATGGLYTETQYDLEDEKSRAAFRRLKNDFVNEYSIGYDPFDEDYSTEGEGNNERRIRNIRTIRLWEYSPVIWGMNPATATVGVKGVTDDTLVAPLDKAATAELEVKDEIVETEIAIDEALDGADTTTLTVLDETKAGRTISAATARRILAAVDELRGLLTDAGVLPGEDDADDESAEGKHNTPVPSEARPQQAAPTDVTIEQQKLDIEMALLELKQLQCARHERSKTT